MFRFLLPVTQGLINLEKQMDSIPDSPIKPFNGIKLHALSPSQLKKKKQPIKYNQSFGCKVSKIYTKILAGNTYDFLLCPT